jgi:hypothetical protein
MRIWMTRSRQQQHDIHKWGNVRTVRCDLHRYSNTNDYRHETKAKESSNKSINKTCFHSPMGWLSVNMTMTSRDRDLPGIRRCKSCGQVTFAKDQTICNNCGEEIPVNA